MRLRLIALFVTLLVCVAVAGAQTILKVDESKMAARFLDGQIEVDLVVENNIAPRAAGSMKIEIVDENDVVIAKNQSVIKIGGERESLKLSIPYPGKKSVKQVIWYRVVYTISAGGSSASGIVSLSDIVHDFFELSVAVPDKVLAGTHLLAYVNAFDPLTKQAVPGISIQSTLKIDLDTESDNDELTIKATGMTNENGEAEVGCTVKICCEIDDTGGKLSEP